MLIFIKNYNYIKQRYNIQNYKKSISQITSFARRTAARVATAEPNVDVAGLPAVSQFLLHSLLMQKHAYVSTP